VVRDLKKKHKLKIGLLGGTFNPPHKGHLYISKDVLKRFQLDCVWWIVTSQNPLKEIKAPLFKHRIELCNQIIDSEKIKALYLEKRTCSNKTIDLLRFLYEQHPKNDYHWIMGSDSLNEFDQWDEWQNILHSIKIIIYDRPKCLYKEIKNCIDPVWIKYKKDKKDYFISSLPAWTLVESSALNISSTEIRNQSEKT